MRAVAEPKYKERVIANASTLQTICGNNQNGGSEAVVIFKTAVLNNSKFVFFTDLLNYRFRKEVFDGVAIK